MSQAYSNPRRASDPHALPDVETFQAESGDCPFCTATNVADSCGDFRCNSCRQGRAGYTVPQDEVTRGWYWHACFPGCLPDGEPNGPFATEDAAIADAHANASDDDITE